MRFLIKILLLALIFTAGFYVGQGFTIKLPDGQTLSIREGVKQVSLMLDFGDGKIITFNNINVADGQNVFEVLNKVVSENDIVLEYKDYGDMGVFIESIDKIANDFKTNRFWQYWVNNEYANVGASNYLLKGGDMVEWKYVKGQISN